MKGKKIYILSLLITVGSAIAAKAEPLSLDSCLQLARENNVELKNAQLEIKKAEETKKQALTKYFPNVSGIALGYHSLHPMVEIGMEDIVHNNAVLDLLNLLYEQYGALLGLNNTISLFQHGVTAGVTAVQPVFAGGRIVNGNRLAKIGIEAATLQNEIKERELLQTVEESYWLVVGLQEKRATLEAVQTLLDTIEQNVETAISAGLAIPNDKLRILIKQNEVRSKALQLENGLSLARQALCMAIGLPYSDSLMITDSITVTDLQLMSKDERKYAVLDRPESRLLDLQIRAEQLQKKMDIGTALPQAAFGLAYSYNDMLFDKPAHNGTAFFTVSVPLTDWWETAHKIRQRNYSIEQARNTQQDMEAKMVLQTEQAYHATEEALRHLDIIRTTLAHSEENLRLSQLNYQAGLAPLSDLLEAQSLLLQARNDYTDAMISYRVNLRRYEQLTQ